MENQASLKRCPYCGKDNPATASKCDCGYFFDQELYKSEQASDKSEAPSEVLLSQVTLEAFRKTARWMKFLSIMGFITAAILILGGLGMLVTGGAVGGGYGAGIGAIGFLVYLVMGIIIIIPNNYLNTAARGYKQYYYSKNTGNLATAFAMQKSYWTFMGVLVVIYLCLIGIALLSLIIGSAFSM